MSRLKNEKLPGCEEKLVVLGSAWQPFPTVRDAANGPSRFELDLGSSPVTKVALYASPNSLVSDFSTRPIIEKSKNVILTSAGIAVWVMIGVQAN